MTHRVDVAGGRDIAARWCAFAEQRLEYLTELFETGRWRRYHSERAFLENIQEAKSAVETWRDLAMHEASLHGFPADISRFARAEIALPPEDTLRGKVHWLRPQPADITVESPPLDISVSAETDRIYSDDAPSAPRLDEQSLDAQGWATQGWDARDLEPQDLEGQSLEGQALEALDDTPEEMALDVDAIAQRYPSLRNAL
jgi:uncharacterized repeat protein (TIGR03809 family)